LLVGRLPQKVLIGLHLLESQQVQADKRLHVAKELVNEFPHLAILHLENGILLNELDRHTESKQELLKALDCESDPDTRSRIFSQLACVLEPGTERRDYARQAMAIADGNLFASCIARLILQVDRVG
jgi:hypothetical protein